MDTLRIGCGAGYAGDRIDPSIELVEKGNIKYLVFECLAERTIALAQQAKLKDPTRGYNELLEDRLRAVLKLCLERNVKIISNMGAANPESAAKKVIEVAASMGLKGVKVAAVLGDDVLDELKSGSYSIEENGISSDGISNAIISANAYLGCEPMVEALRAGANVVITGRVADPSLFLAPMVFEFNWALDDWTLLGRATLAGHLLECGAQVTGGYFADPGVKDVQGLARVGYPIVEVRADGDFCVTKPNGSGGAVTEATCTEQMLYEIHDPAAYLTPDVVADFSHVTFHQDGEDKVLVKGADGRRRPKDLKVSVGYLDGYVGEGQLSYGGANAVGRAKLALEVFKERLKIADIRTTELRCDLIGMDSLHGPKISKRSCDPYEVRIRVVGRTNTLKEAERFANECETLAIAGPSGPGGLFKSAKQVMAVASTYMPRSKVSPVIKYLEV